VDRADATTDVEDRPPVDSPFGEPLDQRECQSRGALLTVGAKMLVCVAGVELTIERGVAR
jgi:hypothetical protein